jgi:hypothetical protein
LTNLLSSVTINISYKNKQKTNLKNKNGAKTMQNPFTHLLDKEMDRREFLVHLGAGFVALLGLSSILKAFTGVGSSQQQKTTTSTAAPRSSGYGSSAYGR